MLSENLNPRKHLSAAIGWAVFLIIALAAPFCAWLVAKETQNYTREASELSLQQVAKQIHREITSDLESRLSVIRLAAAQLDKPSSPSTEAKHLFDVIRSQHPEFDWIGMTNNEGVVIASINNMFVGKNVSFQPWFVNGAQGPYLGDIRYAHALADQLPSGVNRNTFRVIDLAAPIVGENGAVIGAQISWEWIKNLQALTLSDVDSIGPDIQLILVAEDKTVLSGPTEMVAQPLPSQSTLNEDDKYLVGIYELAEKKSATLDWTIVVRADRAQTISAARSAQLLVVLTIMGAGSLAALLIVYSVGRLTRNLRKLSEDAALIASGEEYEFKPVKGLDEVSRIGQVLATSVNSLQRQKQSLQELNSELDQRVEDRTQTIARLSAESRETALTQQRLRFARDMHDTLAHSMMAVLTQIRLVRKVRNRLSENEVEEELQRAEDVALSGLKEARDAIQQIRTKNFEDKTISVALHELVERYRARSTVQYTLGIDPKSIRQEDSRAQTIYRIVEEILRNIEKHSMADTVEISLNQLDSTGEGRNSTPKFQLEITDNGIGFDVEKVGSGHYGLIGLREHAELMNGTLRVDSAPGKGTKISLNYSAYYS